MSTFFDETGSLNIEELIIQQPTFQKIIEDGIITDKEIEEQKQRVISLLKDFEQESDPEQIDRVRKLLAEISVLIAITNTREGWKA